MEKKYIKKKNVASWMNPLDTGLEKMKLFWITITSDETEEAYRINEIVNQMPR